MLVNRSPDKHRSLDLHGAFVRRIDLSGASLRNANMAGADAANALFNGADFEGAVLEGTILRRANLTGAKNSTLKQISEAVSDRYTILPDYIDRSSIDHINAFNHSLFYGVNQMSKTD